MTPSWRRQLLLLSKVADVVFENLAGSIEAWNSESPRPLFVVRIVFPFFRHPPWQLGSTPNMFAVGRELSKVWKDPNLDSRNILRKLCQPNGRLDSGRLDVVPKLLLLPRQS